MPSRMDPSNFDPDTTGTFPDRLERVPDAGCDGPPSAFRVVTRIPGVSIHYSRCDRNPCRCAEWAAEAMEPKPVSMSCTVEKK